MLMMVAMARAYGTEQMLLPTDEDVEDKRAMAEDRFLPAAGATFPNPEPKNVATTEIAPPAGAVFPYPPRPLPGASGPQNPADTKITAKMAGEAEADRRRAARRRGGDGAAYTGQIKTALPHMFNDDTPMLISAGATTEERGKADLVCGTCRNFDGKRNYCTLRDLYTLPKEPLCEVGYDPMSGDDDGWE